jgi:hypothetical protein
MSPEQESFEQIRRVLALKRHEIPPPGYFHHFSREVIVRIKAGETGETHVFVGQLSWFKRFWHVLDTKPVWAGALGAAVCGFFVVGAVISSESSDNSVAIGDAQQMPVSLANAQAAASWQSIEQPGVSAASVEMIGTETPRTSLFNEMSRLRDSTGVGTFNVNYVPANN